MIMLKSTITKITMNIEMTTTASFRRCFIPIKIISAIMLGDFW